MLVPIKESPRPELDFHRMVLACASDQEVMVRVNRTFAKPSLRPGPTTQVSPRPPRLMFHWAAPWNTLQPNLKQWLMAWWKDFWTNIALECES